jgi:hypothetical protein
MLSPEQLAHVADHGWVLLENQLDPQQCDAYIAALDRVARTRRPLAENKDAPDLTWIDNVLYYDDSFVEWLKLPGILDANRQLVGARIRYNGSFAHIKRPHPDRHTRRQELADPDGWNWHRGFRPKWANFPHDSDDRLLNYAMVNNLTYFTPVSPGSGGTAVLDGSHRVEGDYRSLKSRFPVVEVTAPAGSILVFTETLIHSAVPILSETTRYNIYYGFTPAWFSQWPGYEAPQSLVDRLADEELRDVLGAASFSGQKAER